MTTSRIVTVAAAAVLAGAPAAQAQQVSEKSNRDRKVITTEEIEAAQGSTAYQVVERLRPEFLRRMSRPQAAPGGLVVSRGGGGSTRGGSATAGGGSPGAGARGASGQSQNDETEQLFETPQQRTAAVFVDGTEMGGVEELQRIQANMVEEIRYLTGPDAGAKYGPRFSAGVIEVKLRNR